MKSSFNFRDQHRQSDARVETVVGQRNELLKQRDQENLQFLKRIFDHDGLKALFEDFCCTEKNPQSAEKISFLLQLKEYKKAEEGVRKRIAQALCSSLLSPHAPKPMVFPVVLQQQVNFLIGFIEGEKEEEKCDNADKLDLKPEPVTQPEPDAEAGEPVLDKDKDKETLEKEARRYDRNLFRDLEHNVLFSLLHLVPLFLQSKPYRELLRQYKLSFGLSLAVDQNAQGTKFCPVVQLQGPSPSRSRRVSAEDEINNTNSPATENEEGKSPDSKVKKDRLDAEVTSDKEKEKSEREGLKEKKVKIESPPPNASTSPSPPVVTELSQANNSTMSNSRERTKSHRRSASGDKDRAHVTTNNSSESIAGRDHNRERRGDRGTSQERVGRRRSEKATGERINDRLDKAEREFRSEGLSSPAQVSPTNSDSLLSSSPLISSAGSNDKDDSISPAPSQSTIEKKKREAYKSSERQGKRTQSLNKDGGSQCIPSIISTSSLSFSGGRGMGIVMSGKMKPDVRLRVIDQNDTHYTSSILTVFREAHHFDPGCFRLVGSLPSNLKKKGKVLKYLNPEVIEKSKSGRKSSVQTPDSATAGPISASKDTAVKQSVPDILQVKKLGDSLCNASWNNDMEKALSLLQGHEAPYIINHYNERGQTALYCACRQGHVELVRHMLSISAIDLDLQMQGHMGTALHAASFFCYVDICAMLLYAGANASIRNSKGLVCVEEALSVPVSEVFQIHSKDGNEGIKKAYPFVRKKGGKIKQVNTAEARNYYQYVIEAPVPVREDGPSLNVNDMRDFTIILLARDQHAKTKSSSHSSTSQNNTNSAHASHSHASTAASNAGSATSSSKEASHYFNCLALSDQGLSEFKLHVRPGSGEDALAGKALDQHVMKDVQTAYQQYTNKPSLDIKEWKVKKKHVEELVRLERTIKEAYTIKSMNIGVVVRSNAEATIQELTDNKTITPAFEFFIHQMLFQKDSNELDRLTMTPKTMVLQSQPSAQLSQSTSTPTPVVPLQHASSTELTPTHSPSGKGKRISTKLRSAIIQDAIQSQQQQANNSGSATSSPLSSRSAHFNAQASLSDPQLVQPANTLSPSAKDATSTPSSPSPHSPVKRDRRALSIGGLTSKLTKQNSAHFNAANFQNGARDGASAGSSPSSNSFIPRNANRLSMRFSPFSLFDNSSTNPSPSNSNSNTPPPSLNMSTIDAATPSTPQPASPTGGLVLSVSWDDCVSSTTTSNTTTATTTTANGPAQIPTSARTNSRSESSLSLDDFDVEYPDTSKRARALSSSSPAITTSVVKTTPPPSPTKLKGNVSGVTKRDGSANGDEHDCIREFSSSSNPSICFCSSAATPQYSLPHVDVPEIQLSTSRSGFASRVGDGLTYAEPTNNTSSGSTREDTNANNTAATVENAEKKTEPATPSQVLLGSDTVNVDALVSQIYARELERSTDSLRSDGFAKDTTPTKEPRSQSNSPRQVVGLGTSSPQSATSTHGTGHHAHTRTSPRRTLSTPIRRSSDRIEPDRPSQAHTTESLSVSPAKDKEPKEPKEPKEGTSGSPPISPRTTSPRKRRMSPTTAKSTSPKTSPREKVETSFSQSSISSGDAINTTSALPPQINFTWQEVPTTWHLAPRMNRDHVRQHVGNSPCWLIFDESPIDTSFDPSELFIGKVSNYVLVVKPIKRERPGLPVDYTYRLGQFLHYEERWRAQENPEATNITVLKQKFSDIEFGPLVKKDFVFDCTCIRAIVMLLIHNAVTLSHRHHNQIQRTVLYPLRTNLTRTITKFS